MLIDLLGHPMTLYRAVHFISNVCSIPYCSMHPNPVQQVQSSNNILNVFNACHIWFSIDQSRLQRCVLKRNLQICHCTMQKAIDQDLVLFT